MDTPKIRFPGFVKNWEKNNVSELVEIIKSYSYSRNEESEYGMVSHIHYGDIHSKFNNIIDNNSKLPFLKLIEIKDLVLLEKGDIILADASEDYNGLGTTIINLSDRKDIIGGLHTFVLRPDKEKLYSLYFLNYSKTSIYKKYMQKIGTGASVFGISKANLEKLTLLKPSLEEQQKVGDFFMLLDKRIEQQEQKIALLKDYKKAMMQKIFSQKIRFKDENGNDYPDWEEKMLGEIGVFYRGHSYKATDVSSEGLLVLRSNNISNDSITLNTGLQYVTKKCNNEIILENNDIVICMANGSKNLVGKSGIFHKENEFQTVTAGAFCSIYRTQNSLSRYLFQTDKYKKYLSILFSGTNINNLKNSDLEELKFKLPKRAEEERIFLLFQKLDINIEKQEGILENLKNQKEVLLQKMFI